MEKSPNFVYIKFIGILVLIGVLTILGVITVNLVTTNIWAFMVVVSIISALAVSMCVLAFHWVRGKILEIRTKERLNALMLQEREVEIEAKRREINREDRKVEIVNNNASWMSFSGNDVLAVRDSNGGVDIKYIPERVNMGIAQIDARGEVLESVVSEEIEDTILASEMMMQYGQWRGKRIMLGLNGVVGLVAYEWKKLGSVLILGIPGGGKTNTASWIVGQEVENGAKVALIDKHARSEESTYYMLNEMRVPFATAVADNPASAERVVDAVEKEYLARLAGSGTNERILFVIDEFTAMVRSRSVKGDAWQQVSKKAINLVEVLNSEGRKFGINCVCMGQVTSANRAGGTEVRDIFKTIIIHGMRKRQAQNLGMTEEKDTIQGFSSGEVYVDIEGEKEPLYVKVPLIDDAYIAARARSTRYINARSTRSTVVREAFNDELLLPGANDFRTVANGPEHYVERLEADEERVLQLRRSGVLSKAKIIAELWQATKGSSEKYKKAEKRYEDIIEKLTTLGLI